MVHRVKGIAVLAAGFGIVLGVLSACTTNPFEPTTDTVSSTSGHSWWNEDGIVKSEYKAIAFVAYNKTNLEQDVAKGGGEYLTSMGTLLGVSPEGLPTFQSAARDRFSSLSLAAAQSRLDQLRSIAQ